MIKVGQKMCFIPHWDIVLHDDKKTRKAKTVTGVVTIVNYKHKIFWCEYDHYCSKQVETFKFCDIGDVVWRA